MQRYEAFLHISPSPIRFIGNCWEDGGFSANESGEPLCDVRGNTVAGFSVRDLTPADDLLLAAAYAGDESIEDAQAFREYLVRECGLSLADAFKVCRNLSL